MLYINLQKILADRGIERLIPYLRQIGLAHYTAKKMLSTRNKYLSLEHAERICMALNCTPNELLEWRPDAGADLAADHPLQKLRPKEVTLSQQLRQLSPDDLNAVQQFIGSLQEAKAKGG